MTREEAISFYLSATYRTMMDEERKLLEANPGAAIEAWDDEWDVLSTILSMSDEEYEAIFHDPRFHCDDPDWYRHRGIKK